ncbi:hypothetical protein OSB04_019509 [Centaurea solstitialis]|uniref:Uncharacterized protein n=1 Tax=Centaurea solstitialis TaxID=347529 RepID=A0AA38WFZ4_9ASTR|nr:hypothetical protein OSB04_019509 [Centaurea solstitialis]
MKSDLDSLEKVNLSFQSPPHRKEIYAPRLLDLFQKLCGAKFLILDNCIIKVLSACRDLLDERCPFYNLKSLKIDKQKNRSTVPTRVKNYFLESSPSVTFIMDLPQVPVPHERARKEVDKDIMAKKGLSSCTEQLLPIKVNNQLLKSSPSAAFNMDLPQVPHKRSRLQADDATMANTLEKEKTTKKRRRRWRQ